MKTILRFEFDRNFFPKGYTGPRSVKITDPPVIPATGDGVDFRIEEFFDDADVINNFKDVAEGQVLYAERLNTIFGKNETEVIVVIYEEAIFKELFPRFFEAKELV